METKVGLIALYLGLVVFLFCRRRQMIFYLGLLVYSVASLVSLIVIENGAFIIEQNTYGYDIGAFYYYYAYTLLTLLVFFLVCRVIPTQVDPQRSNVIFYAASGIYVVLVLYARWANPEFNRFEVFDVFGPVGKRVVVLFVTFYFMLFTYCCYKARGFRPKLLIFAIYAALQLLRGDQLGGVLEGIIVLATAVYLGVRPATIRERLGSRLRRLWIVPLVGVLMLGIVWYKVVQMGDPERFTARVVLQAHVFWGALGESRTTLHPPDPRKVLANAVSLRPTAVSPDYGLGEMMVILSGDYAYDLMAGGARFTGGYPAVLILYFGFWPSMIINVAATALYVLCLALIMYLINHVNCFVFMLAMKLIYGYSTEFYGMGEYVQFNLKYFLGLALLCAIVAPKILARLTPRGNRNTLAAAPQRANPG